MATQSQWEALLQTVKTLRSPGGCPWDREQTHSSLRPYLIEETAEVLECLDEGTVGAPLKEELGDVLLQVLLHSQIASEEGRFSIEDVVSTLNEKLIRRHPHVFSTAKIETSDQVITQWEEIKKQEKGSSDTKKSQKSVLAGVVKTLPALERASKTISKVSKVGFQWKDLTGPREKLHEELREFEEALAGLQKEPSSEPLRNSVESELGDLLFSICNVASFLKISPESALRNMLGRFTKRFRFIEMRVQDSGRAWESFTLEELDTFWKEAKQRPRVIGLTGGIGSGKSAVAKWFRAQGIPVIDADAITHQLHQPGSPIETELKQLFGSLDRTVIRERVFREPKLKHKLEALMHPAIRKLSWEMILSHSGTAPLVIYEAALLVETDRYADFDGLITVEAEKEVRVQRVIDRDGCSRELVEKIITQQAPRELRAKHATWVMENNGTVSELEIQLYALLKSHLSNPSIDHRL